MNKETIEAIIRAAEKARATADKNCGWEQPVIDADLFIQALREEIEDKSSCSGYCHKAKRGEVFTCSCLCCKVHAS